MKDAYPFREIEQKWQKAWEEKGAFQAADDPSLHKYYCLEMYPYPSGRIHMGHVRNYSIGDVMARFSGCAGFNVLHPIGWDALGMPAENAAIKHGIHPQTVDAGQHREHEEPAQAARHRLRLVARDHHLPARVLPMEPMDLPRRCSRAGWPTAKSWVNWCPQCQTVLANEQVAGGGCWRCDTPVEQKEMEQWFLRITAYAQELLDGHKLGSTNGRRTF